MSKDLFDETTMTFGEHLEVLRRHLWRAIIGLVVAVTIAFFFSKEVLLAVQAPVTGAMQRYFNTDAEDKHLLKEPTAWEKLKGWWSGTPDKPAETGAEKNPASTATTSATTPAEAVPPSPADPPPGDPESTLSTLVVEFDAVQIASKLNAAYPQTFPAPPKDAKPVIVRLPITRESHLELQKLINAQNAAIRTDTVDEAFMIYLKVSVVCGLVLASPYIFYEIWLFVAAGLYPHERKYVYTYLPLSLFLFLGGAVFCFYMVIPFVLDFLFGFNKWLGLRPELKISSWLSFVILLPLMFGISFQLPLVMVFLEKINLFSVQIYRGYRRHSILVISVLSMILTPSDPISMLMMMVPLVVLYEFGVLLCGRNSTAKSPFGAQPAQG